MYAESMVFGGCNVPGPILPGRVGVVDHARLLGLKTSLKQQLFPVTAFQHVQVQSDVSVGKHVSVERGFARRLDADKENEVHCRDYHWGVRLA